MQLSGELYIPFYFMHSVCCDEYIEKINDEIFKRNYFIDIRNFSKEKLDDFFENFSKFQEDLVMEQFFKNKSFMSIYFICSKELKKDPRVYRVLKDYQYADKHFITEEEYELIRANSSDLVLFDNIADISHNGIVYPLSNFNLIYGNNGSGKTELLESINYKFGGTLFNMSKDIGTLYINDNYMEYLKKIYATNTGKEEYFNYLLGIIYESRQKHTPILIDDLCWGSLDDDNKIRVIDILGKSSFDNMVAITACQNQVKRLVNNRIYKPNIIEL